MKAYLLLILILVGVCVTLSIDENKETSGKDGCFLIDIEFLTPRNCSSEVDVGKIGHLGSCTVEGDTIYKCINGQWSGTENSVASFRREKRFFGFVLGALAGCVLFCGIGGGSSGGQTIIKYPPHFPEPCRPVDLQENYNIKAGEDNVIVTWTVPTPTDRDGDVPRVDQIGGGLNGGRFDGATYGKTHHIIYRATDSDGLTGHCYFLFTVTVLTCDPLPWLSNGRRYCDNKNVLGSVCHYTCNAGYVLNGSSTVTCENGVMPSWSAIPRCEKIKCSEPIYPDHTTAQCSDPNYGYQSVCSMACDSGYTLKGPYYLQCQADGTWSNVGASSCVDSTPPTISCVTPQIIYADRGLTSTSSNWQLPTASDNTDESPSIEQTYGPTMGTMLEVGTEIIKYRAVDVEGNETPECLIALRIEVIKCGHPLENIDDDFLKFDCSTPRMGYISGSSCNVYCRANLPLNGSDLITCEDNGKFEGNWNFSGEKPFCRKIYCPELEAPINGALVFDEILTRPIRQLVCNENYDLPELDIPFDGLFFCTDDGDWIPSFPKVPNCIVPHDPRFMKLPTEIFYYGGECGTAESLAEIESNFRALIESNIHPYFATICPPGKSCTVEDIFIKCGPINNRRKRSLSWEISSRHLRSDDHKGQSSDHIITKRSTETHLLVVEFHIVTSINLANTSLQDAVKFVDNLQIEVLVPAVNEMLQNGTLDIENFVHRSDSLSTPKYGEISCDENYVLDKATCKPCPIGYFLNITSKKCDACPFGQYKDNESDSDCLFCKSGYSTRLTGSTSIEDCVKQCPGYYSPDTFETCSTCRHGYYQDEYGQKTCKKCPSGTSTVSSNSTSKNDCKNFDVYLKETNGDVTVAEMNETLTNFTFMFWKEAFDATDSNASLVTLTSGGSILLSIYMKEYVRIEIPSLVNETIGNCSSTAWSHVGVTWDTSNSRVTLYVNGEDVHTASFSSMSPLIQTESLQVSSSSKTGIHLTGLHLVRRVLSEIDMRDQAKSCHTFITEDVINTGKFLDISDLGISLVVESSCYAFDACLPSPCNGHICNNRLGGYTCTCNSGWSGTNCTTPPDFCIDNACVNGATCISKITNYTCSCIPGYSGTFCEITPVNGDWSVWSESKCSKSCGTGSITKTRECNNLSPDIYGDDCVGNTIEILACNTQACPVCKEFTAALGTVLSCSTNETTGSESCKIYCEDCKVLPPGLINQQSFTCGPRTNYEWDYFDNPPSCIDPVSPGNVNITVNVTYTSEIKESSISDFKNQINDQISVVPCFDSPNCETDIEINQSLMAVMFRITTAQGPDLQYSEFISNGIPSDTLQEIIDAINYLEQTGFYIQNNTNELFDVIVDGERYTVADENLTINAGVSCNTGFVVIEGICVACPAGTFFANNTCSFCEKGKYQPNTGETFCLTCPAWQTTKTIGSTNSSQCKSFDVCALYPCNGHVCINGQDGYICTCHDGWSGKNCDTPPDFCIGNACVNGATCRSEPTNYTCSCLSGYTGQYCEISSIDGGWSEWSLSGCSKSCGKGVMIRTRTCDNPGPNSNGADCIGDALETVPCNSEDCPVDGGWSEWSHSECSKTCGTGSLNRIRKCNNPIPESNGVECVGGAKETIACNTDTCPVDGGWSEWTSSECSQSCGTGAKTRTRLCNSPVPESNGSDCVGDATETVVCNTENCPLDGGWSEWSHSLCSKTCGTGSLNRIRKCNNPIPESNGAECVGDANETRVCNTDTCPVPITVSTTTKLRSMESGRETSQVGDNLTTITIVIPVVAFCIIFGVLAFIIWKRRNKMQNKETSTDTEEENTFYLTSVLQLSPDLKNKSSADAMNVGSDFINGSLNN